jgi:lipopolysaccharide export system protein LptA
MYRVLKTKMMKGKRLWAAISLALLPLIVFSQVKPAPQKDTSSNNIILIDDVRKLIQDNEGVETVKWLSQGFQLRIDSTNIYGDSAVIYGEDRVHAYKEIIIQQGDSLHVFTDTLHYDRIKDVARLIGEVALVQGTRQLWTNHLTYFLGARYGEYNNGGTLVDGPLQVSSRKGIYWADREEVKFVDSVVVLHPKFNLVADSMRYLAAQDKVLFTGPTNIYTRAAKIFCEGGYYDLNTETAEFNRNAQYSGNGKNATADTIRYMAKTGEVEMMGNVIVEESDRTITASYLQYMENTGETHIVGSPAVYKDSTRSIISPEIFYNERTNQVTTKGRGQISLGDLIIDTDQSSYDELTGLGKLTGNVIWRDTVKDVGIRAENIDYSQKTEYMLAYGSTRPLFFTIIENDTLFITADTLNMWSVIDTTLGSDTIRMIRMYHDVRLYKSNMQGLADSLVYNGRDSLFTFYDDPVLWSDTTQFSGDSIFMHLSGNQIKDITLARRAMIVSELLDVYYDQIKGKTIVAEFDSSEIQEMLVTGNAESIYYTRDDKSAFIGVNKTICSKMFFTFNNGEIYI